MSDAGPRDGLSTRLTRLALGTAAIALLVAGLLLDGAMFFFQRHTLQQEATAQARVLAENTSAALMFSDAAAARDTLRSIEHSTHVSRVSLYSGKGQLFADHRRLDAELPPEPPALPETRAGLATHGAEMVVVERVQGQAGTVGWLRLQVPLAPLYRQTLLFAVVTLGAAGVAMALAWSLGAGVRREVARIERRLDELAHQDPVTGLFNRHAAAEHLAGVARRGEAAPGFSILSFDLDNFKTINDTLGHPIGDEVLRGVAHRLKRHLSPGARAYRFGGDEFVVICPSARGLEDPTTHGELVRRALGDALQISGYEIPLSGSVGVARWPKDSATPEEVLRASDIAMYEAKTRGKNGIVIFDPSLRADSQERLRVESDLRTAIREGQLCLHYQPLVEVGSGRWRGAEALVRWQHPTRGLLAPAAFIDVAERSGLVAELGGWVLREAAQQLVRWRQQGVGPVRVAVNVSARQLKRGLLLQQFREAVGATGLPASQLGLEIELTEHTLVEDVDDNLALLEELRAQGVRIAIDDFGTGLSSLAYLKRLPIDKLKIDRSFVKGLPGDAGDLAIVGAALSMARALGLVVVAEGVETEAQHQVLREMGCELAQGWLFSKALPAEGFALGLRRQAAEGQRAVSAGALPT